MFILASHIYLSNVGFRFKLDRVFYLASHIYISNVGYRFKRDRVSFYFSYQGKTGKIAFGCFQFINNAHCFFFLGRQNCGIHISSWSKLPDYLRDNYIINILCLGVY